MARRSKAVGEIDIKDHVKIAVDDKATQFLWVRITKGDKRQGTGVLDSDQAQIDATGLKMKLGDVVRYAGGPAKKYPRFTSKVHEGNKKQMLLDDVAKALIDAMQFNPKRQHEIQAISSDGVCQKAKEPKAMARVQAETT